VYTGRRGRVQIEKPSAPKCSEGLRKSSGMLYQLFSSFLRGASCPKSPRAPPLPATLFMRLTGRYVKPEKLGRGLVSDDCANQELDYFLLGQ